MKLITKALARRLPPLNATEDDDDPMVQAKFFYPDYGWSWYAIEFDGEDFFFGFVDGDVAETGLFQLSELLVPRGMLGLAIKRDRYFRPCPLSELRARLGR